MPKIRTARADTPLQREIRAYMARTKTSMRALSFMVGTNDSLVKKIMAGKSDNSRGDTLAKLAKVMGVNVAVLAAENEQPIPDGPDITYYEELAQRLNLAIRSLPDAPPVADVAAVMGVSEEKLRRMARGLERPEWLPVAKLCRRFRVSADWLLQGDENYLRVGQAARLAQAAAEMKEASAAAPDRPDAKRKSKE